MLGAIEAGGTKFLCAAAETRECLEPMEIPTTTPAETLSAVADYFRRHPVEALGLACFGPLDLNRESATYGQITATPKIAWRNCDVVGTLARALEAPIAFDTDVNAAALAEGRWGAAQGSGNFVYFTVGTGIGGGAVSDGRLLHGAVHPEMGHIIVRRHPDDPFAGACPSHHDCLEGLASGPAIAARWGAPAQTLERGHAAWPLEAYYLAQAALTAGMMLSSELVVFGGGVARQPGLIDLINAELGRQVGGYLTRPPRVARTALGAAGLLGAFLMAESVATSQ